MAAFSEFVECVYNYNDEASSDEDTGSFSDLEAETQEDSEDDAVSALESDDLQVDSRNQIISGRTWRYVAPRDNGSMENTPRNATLTAKSENVRTVEDCFDLFINNEIVDTIVTYTNEAANEFHDKECKGPWKPVDRIEISAFIGLLLITGRFRESRESTDYLWRQSTAYSRLIYTAIMPRNRFADILRFLRFDDHATRADRKLIDKLAALRTVTNILQANCRDCYEASQRGTIDGQLMSFRGRCPFKVYMPSKPGRYGVKIWNLWDVQTFYCCNFDVYLGKIGNTIENQQGQRVVEELTNFWRESGRTVTTDHSFTDISLAERLLRKKIFLVGAISKNRKDLPKSLASTRGRAQHSSDFLFTNDLTLVSYVPKPQKCVILLSSLHKEHSVSGPEDNYKPDVLSYYNGTKRGIDALDNSVREYSCRRATRRWPVSLFMHYIDTAAHNAMVIWLMKNPEWESQSSMESRRKVFLEALANSLYSGNIERRAGEFESGNSVLHKHVVTAIEATGRKLRRQKPSSSESRKRSRCYICIGNDNKYATRCLKCTRHICKIHAMYENNIVCTHCI